MIRSIESDTKPEDIIGLLEAGADPNATEVHSYVMSIILMCYNSMHLIVILLLLEPLKRKILELLNFYWRKELILILVLI